MKQSKKIIIDSMSAMAQGLFCSLLVGTILNTLGTRLGINFLVDVGTYASKMAGPAMAVAIGFALKSSNMVVFSLAAVGYAANTLGGAGGPLAVYVIAIVSSFAGKLVSGKTKVDILVTPIVTVLAGVGLSILIAPSIGKAAFALGNVIMIATELKPFFMGIAVSVLVGMALTLPISSAAICASLSLTGLAGGAALAGCCAQMVGFAVMSFKENKWSGLVSQGIGTSMLQMGNIIKNPSIWIAPILTSVITGPVSTCLLKLQMNGPAVSSGMGTCGFVGQIGVYSGWIAEISQGTRVSIGAMDWIGLVLVSFVLPAVICPLINIAVRKIGLVKDGDMAL